MSDIPSKQPVYEYRAGDDYGFIPSGEERDGNRRSSPLSAARIRRDLAAAEYSIAPEAEESITSHDSIRGAEGGEEVEEEGGSEFVEASGGMDIGEEDEDYHGFTRYKESSDRDAQIEWLIRSQTEVVFHVKALISQVREMRASLQALTTGAATKGLGTTSIPSIVKPATTTTVEQAARQSAAPRRLNLLDALYKGNV